MALLPFRLEGSSQNNCLIQGLQFLSCFNHGGRSVSDHNFLTFASDACIIYQLPIAFCDIQTIFFHQGNDFIFKLRIQLEEVVESIENELARKKTFSNIRFTAGSQISKA